MGALPFFQNLKLNTELKTTDNELKQRFFTCKVSGNEEISEKIPVLSNSILNAPEMNDLSLFFAFINFRQSMAIFSKSFCCNTLL